MAGGASGPPAMSEDTARLLRDLLIPGTVVSDVRHYPVAVTTEALALAWLRQEEAPHGALVVADTEISARTRNDDVLPAGLVNASVVVRTDVAVDHQDIFWGVALLSALAGSRSSGGEVAPHWPEDLIGRSGRVGAVKVASQLSGGRATSAVLTFRLGIDQERGSGRGPQILSEAMAALGPLLALPPAQLADRFRLDCGLVGRRVRIDLRPRGSSGGVGASIDERGAFGVAASSGSVSRFGVDQVRAVTLLE